MINTQSTTRLNMNCVCREYNKLHRVLRTACMCAPHSHYTYPGRANMQSLCHCRPWLRLPGLVKPMVLTEQCQSIGVNLRSKNFLLPWSSVMATYQRSRMVTTSSSITVTPSAALVDEKVEIRLTGLEPGSTVTIRSLIEERKMKFESHAHYIANLDGSVNLSELPSVGGNYIGIESMGLFWSMVQSPGQRRGLRFAKLDVDSPIVVNLSLHKAHLDTNTLQNDIPVATTQIHRWYKADNVEKITVRHGKVRGAIFKPKGSGPFPGVIDMFGSIGALIPFRAALLASRGFAALSLPFFGYDDLPESNWDMDFEYFEEAAKWVSNQSYVSPGGIGVLGVSMGGQIGLTMAEHFKDIVTTVVSISGPCATLFPWTYRFRGKYMPPLGYDPARKVEGEFGVINYVCPDDIQRAPENTKIQVEKACNLLLLVGEADLNFPSALHATEAVKRLQASNHQNYQLLSYPGAGHLIEPPYSPFCRCSFHREMGWLMDWGGNMVDHARAQEDAWPRVLQFLRKHVGEGHR